MNQYLPWLLIISGILALAPRHLLAHELRGV
jgi:hypothetical protein